MIQGYTTNWKIKEEDKKALLTYFDKVLDEAQRKEAESKHGKK